MLFEKEHYYAENKAHCFYFGEKKPQEKSEQIQYVFNYCFSQLVSGRSSATNPAIWFVAGAVGNRQSFTFFTFPSEITQLKFISIHF